MGTPGAARPWSRPPRRLVQAAVAGCGPVACAVDAVLRCFGAAILVRYCGVRVAPTLGRWVGGEEGCAVELLGYAAAVLARYVLLRLAPLAVPMFLLQTLGRALIDAVEKEGGSKVKEVSTMPHHPENKVGWRQMAKYVNLSTIAMYNTTLFLYFISIWMKQAIENGFDIPTVIVVLVEVVCLVASFVSMLFLLKRLISDVRDSWSS